MFFQRKRLRSAVRIGRRHLVPLVGFGLVSTALIVAFGSAVRAQESQVAESVDAKLKAVEHERDDLKRRNADLELKLKQLQATVDSLVHQALGEHTAAPPTPLPPPAGMFPRRPPGPVITRFRPMFPPFSGIIDPVALAVAFSDALGEKEAARGAIDAAKQKASGENGETPVDGGTASGRLLQANRKVQLLRTIILTARKVAAEEAERMRKLGAVHAVSAAEVRNAEARLEILDQILASDPDAPKAPAGPTASTRATTTKPLFSE